MRTALLAILASLAVLGCTDADDESEPDAPVNSDPAEILMSNQAAYESACARCHDTPDSGAPQTGDRSVWEHRSPMWEAVLSEHAIAGYLDMPAKGDSPGLTDREVTSAVEYMMSLTYPERLPD